MSISVARRPWISMSLAAAPRNSLCPDRGPNQRRRRCARLGWHSIVVLSSLLLFFSSNPGIYSADSEWEFPSGHWDRTATALSQKDPVGVAVALALPSQDRYSGRVRVRFSPPAIGAAAGLILQAADCHNYYVFCIEKKKGGVYAVLKTARDRKITYLTNEMVGDEAILKIDPARWQELRAEVEGSTVAGYLNGHQVVAFSFNGQPPKWYAHPALWATDLNRGRAGVYTNGTAAE